MMMWDKCMGQYMEQVKEMELRSWILVYNWAEDMPKECCYGNGKAE